MEWKRIKYGPGEIEARVGASGQVEARSLTNGQPCTFDAVLDNVLIEDDRRSVCVRVAAAMAKADPDLRWKLTTDPDVNYTEKQLKGEAAVILLTAARAAIGAESSKLDDLTSMTWGDLVAMIPTEGNYEA